MRKWMFLILCCVFFNAARGDDQRAAALFGIDWTGTAAMRDGNYSSALQQLLLEPVFSDSIFRCFKLGIIYYRLGSYYTALTLMQRVMERCPAIAPIVYIYIAEIEKTLGDTGNALAAYRSVLKRDKSRRYRHYVFEKMRDLVESDSTITMEQAPWLEEYFRWLEPLEAPTGMTLADTIEQYLKEKKWASMDSILTSGVPLGKDACRIVESIRTSLKDTSLSVKSMFRCATAARSCGELTVAQQFLDEAAALPHPAADSLSDQRMSFFAAQLAYDRQDWRKAIKKYKKYLKHFGPNPDAYLSIARAYRNLEKGNTSARWYDKLMAAYPRHPKMQELLWLRAWNFEDARRFDKAAEYYRRIYTNFSKGKRVDESWVRHALCLYKRKQYNSARLVLDNFVKKLPQSPQSLAGYFWQAKCYLAMNKPSDAASIFHLISRKEPFDYYAHRSRRLLSELHDTSDIHINTVCNDSCMIAWFDSVSLASPEKKTLESHDSAAFLNGLYCASIGDLENAGFFLEPLELGFPGNLTLQYKLALLYMHVGASAEAFRIARRMTWRIPPEFRSEMPIEVYKLFYPTFYSGSIINEAKKYKVDPLFISGIIRQESIFDPEIVSTAGAMGLMQIMPYTGRYIAEKRGIDFAADSLFEPYYNIHFGVYYLHELLKDFDNNYVLALAAYNAGPHNARKWKKRNKNKDFDLFIEDIGFTETRGYVKRVLANYWSYQFLSSNTPYTYYPETAEKGK